MKVDYSPRRSGKTTRLIEYMRATPGAVMLTFNYNMAMILKGEYPDLADRIVDWKSYTPFINSSVRPIKEVVIDNADLVISQLFKLPVTRISMSEE